MCFSQFILKEVAEKGQKFFSVFIVFLLYSIKKGPKMQIIFQHFIEGEV
jgi:fumarate reductase subunit C